MLVRIELLKGVGIFHDTTGYSCEFKKITLIYAGNGRGKTTLTSMLRSVATGSNSIILERKTVDGQHMPHVILQFENGKKVAFENGAWSNQQEV